MIDQVTDLLNSQSLQYSYEVTSFLQEIQNLDGIGAKIEKIFQAPAPEEIEQMEQENLSRDAIDDMQNFQRRQNLVQGVYKLKLRSTAFLMAQGISFVSHYSRD